METVGISKIWSFLDGTKAAEITTSGEIRKNPGNFAESYLELAGRVATLQYLNRSHVLFFRGQGKDWTNLAGRTSIKPSIFRPVGGKKLLLDSVAKKRFSALVEAEELLATKWNALAKQGHQKIQRERLLRWAIIQHYEICPTPLLDVTHSLRIAASFAGSKDEAVLYVLAAPNLSGAVTANSEAGLQIVRLASVCPPAAIRPHIQEGYLFSEYPEMVGPPEQHHYKSYEIDFGRRLIGKFRFNPSTFWKDKNFPQVPQDALYPVGRNWFERMASEVKKEIAPLLV